MYLIKHFTFELQFYPNPDKSHEMEILVTLLCIKLLCFASAIQVELIKKIEEKSRTCEKRIT